MARMEPIIEAKDMDIIYNPGQVNEYHAIKKVNIEVYPGEFIGLFGHSGSGKSTLLYNFLGVLPYQKGKLRVAGVDPYELPVMDKVHFLRETIGIIYQAFYLIPSITVIENVALPLTFAGLPKDEREGRAQKVLDRFGVGHISYKFPTMVSGGQLQRSSVARAVTTNPHILLADEPTGNLDSVSTQQVLDTIEGLNQEGQTVVMITHNAAQLRLCHRIYYLTDGVVTREVMNPEKKQIKRVRNSKAIVTEIEQLARIYPYMNPEELKVKSMSNYLLDELPIGQLDRMEKITEEIIHGKMSQEEYERRLAMPMEAGGAGMHTATAAKMARRAIKLLSDSRDITRFRRRLGKVAETDEEQQKLLKRLRDSMLEEYSGTLKVPQVTRLEHAIADRISGAYNPKSFEDRLGTSFKDGGVGLSATTAGNLSRHLEKLLAQGVEQEK